MKEFFKGKIALVTGAGAGIGLATAQAFAEAGAAVALVDINEETVRVSAEKRNRSQGLRVFVTEFHFSLAT